MPTDTSEKGLETRTINLLLESGWLPEDNQDYQPAYCVDLAQLAAFLRDTQPETAQALNLDSDNNTRRRQFLNRLKNEIQNRGIIDVLRKGIEHGQHSVRLFFSRCTGLAARQAIVAEIEAEQTLVSANCELAERMQQRIQDTIARVWATT